MIAKEKDHANGKQIKLGRAQELEDLLTAVNGIILSFIRAADEAAPQRATGEIGMCPNGLGHNVLVDTHKASDLVSKLSFALPDQGAGENGLLEGIEKILRCSVNTWDQGFLDKLYSSNSPIGVVADLVLSVLNTNVHVYQVAPALTIVEKATARALANLFGFDGPKAGGFTCPGGSSSNLTSMVVARNTLYPECKKLGSQRHDFVVLTSAHGHYSVEKGSMIMGLGSDGVWTVPVDADGCMRPDKLEETIIAARSQGKTPFYVNTTAGTTVLGSFDHFADISRICKKYNLWMHIDASWGGPVVFSKTQRWKMEGSHLADSITINPHKMMNVPLTCSFLLVPDSSVLSKANSTAAGYLFHGSDDDADFWDLADMTLQCGRRGDSLKLALAWLYHGANGFETQVDHAFEMASFLFQHLEASRNFVMVSANPPPCLQVCFHYARDKKLLADKETNTRKTIFIAHKLVLRGFMVDYAPGEHGSFLRVVINIQTLSSTIDGLVKALNEVVDLEV